MDMQLDSFQGSKSKKSIPLAQIHSPLTKVRHERKLKEDGTILVWTPEFKQQLYGLIMMCQSKSLAFMKGLLPDSSLPFSNIFKGKPLE